MKVELKVRADGALTPIYASRTYTVEEIAAILDIGRTAAYKFVKEADFRIIRIGNSIRIPKKSFEAWWDSFK